MERQASYEHIYYKKRIHGVTSEHSVKILIVAPAQSIGSAGIASGNGRPSVGRLQIAGTTNYIELPLVNGISTITTKNNVGTTGSGFKIQSTTNGEDWSDISGATVNMKQSVREAVTFNVNTSTPVYIRMLPLQSGAVYFWDMQVNPYISSTKLSNQLFTRQQI